MDALTYDLLQIHRAKGHGSRATFANRWNMLEQMSAELKAGGFRLASGRSLKPKHVEYLIEGWKARNLSPATMLNRMVALRWWADAVNKRSMLAKDNEAYGLAKERATGQPRAQDWQPEKVAEIPCPRVRLSLELQYRFGLRAEEAVKFQLGLATRPDRPNEIALKASWTKGGRARTIPITDDSQRELLARIVRQTGNGCLIPPDKNYIQQLRTYKYQSLNVGIRNPHGLRHDYAQRRYRALTGWDAPARGGVLPAGSEAVRSDRQARAQISNELGHNRLRITDVYLGSWRPMA